MTTSTQIVYDTLADAPKTAPTIVKATGYSDTQVRQCLEALEDLGQVRRHRAAKVQRMGRPPAMWERVA